MMHVYRRLETAMRVLWTLLKIVIGLVLIVPICIIVLATTLGLLGALLGLAILALKLAVIGAIAWVGFRVVSRLFGWRERRPQPAQLKPAPPLDPYYESAMRELDRELGPAR